MTKANIDSALLTISLDRARKRSLQAQLCDEIRRLIHHGRLTSGDRLPPSRVLSQDLSVSRITITAGFDQLISEGYLVGRRGSGVFVAAELSGMPPPQSKTPRDSQPISIPPPQPLIAFESAAPDPVLFPHRDWARLFDSIWRAPEPALISKPDALGWAPLRVAIAGHLRDWRGIACNPAQIVITSGLTDAIDLIARALLPPGSSVLVEEPGHRALRDAVIHNGLECVPGHVDGEGLIVESTEITDQILHAIAVTPSRQFPLGMTMPLSRRLQLLRLASLSQAIVIEDDYDGEYRYQGQPLPAMMSLDGEARVIYLGSFSKVTFSGLRLGFMVVPLPLLEPVKTVLGQTGPRASIVSQPVLARFIRDGQFATHIRRMRRLYAHRQKVLVSEIGKTCTGLLEIEPASAGMHLVAGLSPQLAARMNDTEAAARARSTGVAVRALSTYYAGPALRQGLVLGYAGFDDNQISVGAQSLAGALAS